MIYAIFGCNTYTKHLSVVNLKFSFNWASCILSGNPTSRTWLPPPTLRSSHSLLHYVCVCVCPARFFDFKKPGCDTDEARFTAVVVKNPPANAGDMRRSFSPWVGRSPRRKSQPTPVFSLGKSHGQRGLGAIQLMGS